MGVMFGAGFFLSYLRFASGVCLGRYVWRLICLILSLVHVRGWFMTLCLAAVRVRRWSWTLP